MGNLRPNAYDLQIANAGRTGRLRGSVIDGTRQGVGVGVNEQASSNHSSHQTDRKALL